MPRTAQAEIVTKVDRVLHEARGLIDALDRMHGNGSLSANGNGSLSANVIEARDRLRDLVAIPADPRDEWGSA